MSNFAVFVAVPCFPASFVGFFSTTSILEVSFFLFREALDLVSVTFNEPSPVLFNMESLLELVEKLRAGEEAGDELGKGSTVFDSSHSLSDSFSSESRETFGENLLVFFVEHRVFLPCFVAVVTFDDDFLIVDSLFCSSKVVSSTVSFAFLALVFPNWRAEIEQRMRIS